MAQISCREMLDFLDDYVDGALAEDRLAIFRDHLDGCSQCVDYLETYEKAVKLARCLGKECDVADEAPEALVTAILAAMKKS